MWYDNLECSLTLVAELLAIQMGYLVSNNFLSKEIQIENDYKIIVEALLGFGVCLWRSMLVFHFVRTLLILLKKVDVVWCP